VKGFERFGVTTIARWMTEPLPENVVAYMESGGQLYRLKRIRGYNGRVRPVLASLDHKGYTCTPENKCTLNSVVFLSVDVDLSGVAVKDIIDAVAPACADCWALQDENVRRASLDEHRAPQPVAAWETVGDPPACVE